MINSSDPVLDPIIADDAATMDRLRDQLWRQPRRTSCWMSRIGRWIHPSAHCPSPRPTRAWSESRTSARTASCVAVLVGIPISPRILRAPRRLDQAAHQLAEYFAGERRISCSQAGLPAGSWIPAGSARTPCVDQLWAHRDPRRRGRSHRPCTGGTGSRHCLRHKSAAGRRAVPPGAAQRREARGLCRRGWRRRRLRSLGGWHADGRYIVTLSA